MFLIIVTWLLSTYSTYGVYSNPFVVISLLLIVLRFVSKLPGVLSIMPEIGEIARLVHYLRKHLVGRTISSVKVQEDKIVYGKAGTTADQFQKAVTGNKVLDAQQQGKYFWYGNPIRAIQEFHTDVPRQVGYVVTTSSSNACLDDRLDKIFE